MARAIMQSANRRVCALALALAASAATPTGAWAGQTVEIKDFLFGPEALVVPVGTTVVWRNQDIVPHTATAQDAGWDTGDIPGSAEKAHRFERPGRYAYRCRYHPAMNGVIEVKP
jgi:plastocyanin